ncbi:MAG: hypothetical protein N2376_03615 [Clostridia bacterium]|nr:hypothetical protein [Clostridia bacterium]
MDSFTTPAQGFKPYNTPPCPGCTQNTLGQLGTTGPAPTSMGSPGFQGTLPTGLPTGPNYGTGTLGQQGLMPQSFSPTGMTPGMSPQGFPQSMGPIYPASPAAPGSTAPIVPWNQPMPVTTESLQYMNGFMRTQIGRRVTVDFLIGTNTMVDRTGTLLAVGANYILINEVETDDILLCDFYSIKFIKFYY